MEPGACAVTCGITFSNMDALRFRSSRQRLAGTLEAAPNSTYRVEFFANDPDVAGGIAEGQEFLGFTNVTTDAGGNVTFGAALGTPVATGRTITATATDGTGNTSEFSAARAVTALPTLSVNDVSLTEGNGGT